MKNADKAARAAVAPGAQEARAAGMYNNPTFDQVERLIAAVKANGQPGGGVDPSVLSKFVNGAAYDPAYAGRDNKPTILLKHDENVVAQIPADDFVVYGYALDSTGQAVSSESPSCSLRDRTSNRIVVGSGETIGTLSITLPQGGTAARDFYVRFEMGEGASIGALSFVLPGGGDAVIEPEGGVPAPAAGGATVVKFFESAPGVFAVTTVVAPSVEPAPEEPAFRPADPDDPELAGTISTEGEVNDDGTFTVEGEVNEDGTLTVETEAP